MTQPAPVPAASSPIAPDPITVYREEVLKALSEEFDGDVASDFAKLADYMRIDFEPRWEVGKPPPGREDLVILGIFESEQPMDFKVYVFPLSPSGPKPFLRYTLSRIGAAATVEVMGRETFLAELVDEYVELLDDGEDDDEPVPASPGAPTVVPPATTA